MANLSVPDEAVAAATGSATLEFPAYLATHWHRLLIAALLVAFLVYAFFWLRKRVPIVREFVAFLMARKLWWMMPIVIVFLLLALLIVTMESSVIAPLLYPVLG